MNTGALGKLQARVSLCIVGYCWEHTAPCRGNDHSLQVCLREKRARNTFLLPARKPSADVQRDPYRSLACFTTTWNNNKLLNKIVWNNSTYNLCTYLAALRSNRIFFFGVSTLAGFESNANLASLKWKTVVWAILHEIKQFHLGLYAFSLHTQGDSPVQQCKPLWSPDEWVATCHLNCQARSSSLMMIQSPESQGCYGGDFFVVSDKLWFTRTLFWQTCYQNRKKGAKKSSTGLLETRSMPLWRTQHTGSAAQKWYSAAQIIVSFQLDHCRSGTLAAL